MDHQEAADLGATERYLLGTLDDAQRDAFEEHFFDCVECADDVKSAAAVLAAAGAMAEEARPQPSASRVAASKSASRARRSRPRFAHVRTYAAAMGGLAAGLCLAAYQGFVVIPRLQEEARGADSLQAVPSTFLSLSRGEEPVIAVTPEDRHVSLTLSQSWDRPFSSYRVALRDESGRVVLSETVRARSAAPGDELQLLLPVRGLAAGAYVLMVEGQGGEPSAGGQGGAPVARYSFALERR